MAKGFIQIPLLLAITVGIIAASGASYFGIEQYRGLQLAKIEREKIAIEQKQDEIEVMPEGKADAPLNEINALKAEIATLKKMIPSPGISDGQSESIAATKLSEAKDFRVISVRLVLYKNFLRVEWETSNPSESKIFIWPAREVPGYTSFTSPSRSSTHYVNIAYDTLPIYSIGNKKGLDDFVEYNYQIEAMAGEDFTAEKGALTLSEGIKISISRLLDLIQQNPSQSCETLSTNLRFGSIEQLFCKNYRSRNGLPY